MDSGLGEEDNIVALYQASLDGCISSLNTLMERDPLILHRISLASFSETPLHITALSGHLEFTTTLLRKKPRLADVVDSLGRTPLHLASAEGHTEIAKALLQASTNVCLVQDRSGRIPLHFAAMRGRIEVIKDLIRAQPNSIRVDLCGDSVLHLFIRYNHLNALKLLVESANDGELLDSKDHDGNSILHLAVMLKQMKTIEYLLSLSKIKREANAKNKNGRTALDLLDFCPRDYVCLKIQDILKEAGVIRSTDPNSLLLPTPHVNHGLDEAQPPQIIMEGRQAQSRLRKCWPYRGWCSWVKHLKYQRTWMEETRGALMLVATVIATMTFQAGISPPGGVWQQQTNSTVDPSCRNEICDAGTSILSYTQSDAYQLFLFFNTTSFFASLSVVLLVIGGFPLKNKLFVWIFTAALSLAITFMALAYLWAATLQSSYYADSSIDIFHIGAKIVFVWLVLFVVVILMHAIRLISWMMKWCKCNCNSRQGSTNNIVNV